MSLFRSALIAVLLFSAAPGVLAQTIHFQNLDGVPFPDRLAFSRIGTLSNPPTNGVHERVTLRISNTGSNNLSITGLPIGGPNPGKFTVESAPPLPATVAPGSSIDVTVRYISEAGRRVHNATLTVQSNDPLKPSAVVQLSGYWQPESENNKEPTLGQIIDVFGYGTTVVGSDQSLNEGGKIEAAGDEVIAPYWRRADTSQPVKVRQIAAWHTYPGAHGIFWHYKGSTTASLVFRHHSEDAQTVLPRKNNSSLPAEGTFTPSTSTAGGVFGFRVQSNEWSDPALNNKSSDDCSGGLDTCGHHVRFWPVKDRQGNFIPNTFIMAMDFSGINYDYQDNVYLISNITPEGPVAGLVDLRINAGGPQVTTGGHTYNADIYSSGGSSWTPKCDLGDIKGTTDDVLYRTEYSDGNPFQYKIPAIAGTYHVRLHFAEIAHGNCSGSEGGPGKRVFDVWMEGDKILENFDISAEVDAVTALVKDYYVDMTDGKLNLDFLASVDFPMISAIEVLPTTNQLPVASFTTSPAAGQAPLTVAFDAGASSDNGSITAYEWNFGDGTTATGATVSHTYSDVGTYTVRLTVTDDEGATSTATESISVADPGPISTFTEITWSTVAPQEYVNAEGQGVVVGGKLYSFGGFDSQKSCCTPTKRSYVYDPVANTWTPIADLPHTNGGGATHHGVTTNGTNIFIAGGYISNSAGTGQIFGTKEVYRYNVSSNTYTALPNLPVARAAGRLEYVDGRLHYFGGTNIQRTSDVGDHYVLDLSNLSAGWSTLSPLPNARHHLGSAVLGGNIYAIGGQHGHDDQRHAQVSVHAYNPSTGVWTEIADLPSARSHHDTAVFEGRIISFGGEDSNGNPVSTATVVAYDPSINAWTPLTDMPKNNRSGVAGAIDGALYYTGGNNSKATYKGVPVDSGSNAAPTANFTVSPTSGEAPLIVTFDASGSTDTDGTIVSYAWDFGDGNSATDVTTSHTYGSPGTYDVTLVVTDDEGATGTATTSIVVTTSSDSYFVESGGQIVVEAENFMEKVDRGSHAWILQGKAGSVGSSMVTDPNSGANNDTGSSYSATSPELRYAVDFTTTGTYYVWARVWGDTPDDDSYHAGLNGQELPSADRIALKNGQRGVWFWVNETMDSNARATINVGSSGVHTVNVWMREDGLFVDRVLLTTDPNFVPSGNGPAESEFQTGTSTEAPVASFTASPDNGPAPLEVSFDASASTDNGTIENYLWDFGDGNTGSGVVTTHTYSQSGTFTATLIVTDDEGNSGSTSVNVVVEDSTLEKPSITGTSPAEGESEVRRDAFVAADVSLPNTGQGIDESTLTSNTVMLYPSGNPGAPVTANLNTSGGGDAIVLQPTSLLAANTPYVFEVTGGLKDLAGASFVPFTMSFTTGSEPSGATSSAIEFKKVMLSNVDGKHTSVVVGPDGKLYATQHDGVIKRWTIAADGTLSNLEQIEALRIAEGGNRLLVGLTFDPASTATNLIAWVTHTTFGFSGMGDWGGKITKMSGPNLGTVQDYVVNLPRSIRDHVTNSLTFGPDDALYVNQGSNSAMGAPDNAWGNRPEQKLSAAVLRVDLAALESGTLPLNVRTDDGSYNPYSPGAPVKIFASGVRNAYDLVWHSNGYLYVPTNGSAANGNAPASVSGTIRPDGSAYSGPAVPAIDSVETQDDYLYRIPAPSNGTWGYRYYGHPNPSRGEYVLNGGNPSTLEDPAQVDRYPVGVSPDVAWRGHAFNFGRNISPNGVIEYQSGSFDGLLAGKLLVVRYSGGDDIIILTPDPTSGNIPSNGDMTGVIGMTQFNDPVDLTEHVGSGNLYVAEYGGTGKITLLRPAAPSAPNESPVAQFSASPLSGEAPLEVTFDASASTDNDGVIQSYSWDFDGDSVVDTTVSSSASIKHTYTAGGSYNPTLIVTDDDGAIGSMSTKIDVTSSGSSVFAYVESSGQVVMEMEHFDANISRSGKSWVEHNLSGNVGASMRPEPVTMTNNNTGYSTSSPELQYRVEFSTPGTYYVWTRAQAADGDSDSWHLGLDGQELASADRMTIGKGFGTWKWINKTMDPERATLEVPSAGTYMVNMWMREDGVYLDRLLLTTDPNFTPSGNGPTESPRIETVLTYTESGGQLVMESEHFDQTISRGGKSWVEHTLSGNVGSSMRPEPVNMTNNDTGYSTTSPELQYRVEFNTTGTYYVWLRAQALSGDSDSWHVGIDGAELASADRMTIGNGFGTWKWINKTMDPERATIQIPVAGTYTLNVWMREDGVYLDRLLLTTDPNFTPSGSGPAESPSTEGARARLAAESDGAEVHELALNAESSIPEKYELRQNYPNPFNPSTTIEYALPDQVHVTLEVFDALGRRVMVLIDEVQRPGVHSAIFRESGLANGVYIYRLQAGSFTAVSRMVLVK